MRRLLPNQLPATAAGALSSVLALLPFWSITPGLRLLDDPIAGTLVAVLTTEFAPLAGFGFLMLLGYVAVSQSLNEQSNTAMFKIAHVLGLLLGCGYTFLALLLWINPLSLERAIVSIISELLRTAYLPYSIVGHSIRLKLIDAVRGFAGDGIAVLRRSPSQSVRWPFYLFVAYVGIAELSRETGWLDETTHPVRFVIRLVSATIALTYSLIIAHNFFPSANALPWRSVAIVGWLTVHTILSAGVFRSLQSLTAPESRPSLVATLVILLLLGTTIAVLDGLYPFPELLILGGSVVLLAGRTGIAPQVSALSQQAVDLESRLVNSLAVAWTDPSRLFGLLVAFQGFMLGGWLLWLLLDDLITLSGDGLAVALAVTLLSPLFLAGASIMWFWILEIRRYTSDTDVRPTRFPGLGLFPPLVVISLLTARHLFAIHPILGLMAIAGILIGTGGTIQSLRGLDPWITLPQSLDRHAIPVVFAVQTGTFEIANHLVTVPGPEGSYLVVLLLTLVPLYYFPVVRRQSGSRGSISGAVGLLSAVVVATGGYLAQMDAVGLIAAGFLGFAALGLAVSITARELLHTARLSSL